MYEPSVEDCNCPFVSHDDEEEESKWTVIFVIQRVLGAMIQSVIIVMEQVDVQIHIPVVVGSGKIEMSELCL